MWIFLGLLALGTWRALNGLPARPAGLKHLNRADVAFINAVAEALFPPGGDNAPGGGPMPSAAEAEVLAYVDRYFGWQRPKLRLAMKALFMLFEHGTLLFVPTWARFSQLDAAQREDYLHGWERSRLYLKRLLFQSLRAILCLAYVAHPKTEAALGYTRPQTCSNKAVA